MLAVVSGMLLGVCFAPFGWGDVVWVALTPLIAAVWFLPEATRRRGLVCAGLGYVAGAVSFGIHLFWLTSLTWPGWALLSLYLAVYPAVWAAFLGTVLQPRGEGRDGRPVWLGSLFNLRMAFLAAAAWVALEWARGWVFTGFGWNSLGVAQYANIPLIQIADLAGVGGLSFLIVLVNVTAVSTVKRLVLEVGRGARRPHYDFAVVVGLVALAWTYGIRQLFAPAPESQPLKIAAVQGNIPQTTRNDPAFESDVLETYRRHTDVAALGGPDLILWPESATPRPLFNDQRTWDTVRELAEGFAGDLLVGTVHFSEQGDYNSMALLTNRAQDAQLYHKMHLVPFGEYVPLRQGFPFFAWVVGDLVPDDFDAGPYPQVLEMAAKPVRIGPLICFEDTLAYLAREFALRKAQVFAVATNDGWFLKSAGSRQHVQNAVFRCAENKLPMVRAANTGVTCVVDRFGRIREELRSPDGDTFIEGVLFATVDVPVQPAPTFFTRFGDLLSPLCLLLSGGVLARHIVRRRREVSTCPPAPEEKL